MSVTRDLFGSEISSNAAESFSSGLKGRFNEAQLKDDHQLQDATYRVTRVVDGRLVDEDGASAARHQLPAAGRLHRRLPGRHRPLEQGDREGRHRLPPHAAAQGLLTAASAEFAGHRISPSGMLLSHAEWAAQQDRWLPGEADLAFIGSLMKALRRAGPLRELDRAAADGHQPAAGRLRVRAHRLSERTGGPPPFGGAVSRASAAGPMPARISGPH